MVAGVTGICRAHRLRVTLQRAKQKLAGMFLCQGRGVALNLVSCCHYIVQRVSDLMVLLHYTVTAGSYADCIDVRWQ